MTCPDVAAATPIATYLLMHGCPAHVLPVPPSFTLLPTAAVVVPAGFLHRAQHIWGHADFFGNLTDGEVEYIVTGSLSAGSSASMMHVDAI